MHKINPLKQEHDILSAQVHHVNYLSNRVRWKQKNESELKADRLPIQTIGQIPQTTNEHHFETVTMTT